MNDVYIKASDLNNWVLDYLPNKDLISIDDLVGVIEDLVCEIEDLEYKVKDLENDISENYKPISKKEFYGVSDYE